MDDKLKKKWDEAEASPGKSVDIGDIVACDICSKDYTDSDAIGGFMFETKAVCPECEPEFLHDVARYGEERFIRAKALPHEMFRTFVLRMRGGVNAIRVSIFRGGLK